MGGNKKGKTNIRAALVETLPVLAGYVFLGFAFGLLMRTKGFPLWLPILMSIVIYSGALEFAAVPILASAFNPLGSLLLGLLLSARHLFYGLPFLKKYAETGKIKPFLIFGLTDETFSILTSKEPPKDTNPKGFYFFVTLFNFLYWVGGSALGALCGNLITFDVTGLDFSLTALFVVLFIEQLKNREGVMSGFAGLCASAAVLAIFGSKYFVLISMGIIALVLIVGRRVIQRD